jgi:hypothetical protein
VNRDNYSEQGKFAYKPAELNKILPKEEVSNAGDAIQSIDPTVFNVDGESSLVVSWKGCRSLN